MLDGAQRFDSNPIHPGLFKWFVTLTPAIKSVDTRHESFILNGREWMISSTQVLSQRGSDLTRSIYTLSQWIRPNECHRAAQSNLLLLRPLSTHPSVSTITTPIREMSAAHGDIKLTASGLLSNKTTHDRMTPGPSLSRLTLSRALEEAPLWPERRSEGKNVSV